MNPKKINQDDKMYNVLKDIFMDNKEAFVSFYREQITMFCEEGRVSSAIKLLGGIFSGNFQYICNNYAQEVIDFFEQFLNSLPKKSAHKYFKQFNRLKEAINCSMQAGDCLGEADNKNSRSKASKVLYRQSFYAPIIYYHSAKAEEKNYDIARYLQKYNKV